jgi:hypothetical protein
LKSSAPEFASWDRPIVPFAPVRATPKIDILRGEIGLSDRRPHKNLCESAISCFGASESPQDSGIS